ncbi:MAG: hypothetical protein Q8M11_15345 [Sulfuritalea sp.]|jgi:hypothetical protein|nr:hypothetical protein [Sulfuritalea sp.]MDP1983121.1 hypothetical protein [Sulfuritalea sp.]
MRKPCLLLTAHLLLLLGAASFNATAADAGIRIASIAETEIEVVASDGRKEIKRTALDRAIPGTEVIFTNRVENLAGKPAQALVIDNPIPKETAYKAGSAFGKDMQIAFSADGGKTFDHAAKLRVKGADGKPRVALPDEYTHIRWTHPGQFAAGTSGEVGFRAVVR